MSVRSVLNNFNKFFLIYGFGSINYSQSNFKTTVMLYVLRCIIICVDLYAFYIANYWVLKYDPEMSELTSLISISCFELNFIKNIISHFWRLFFDNQLSIVLTELEAIHEKLIRLKVVGPMKIKMNCYFVISIIAFGIAKAIVPILWMMIQTRLDVIMKVLMMFLVVYECVLRNEYILLILYIKWIVYVINEQIPDRRSYLSTFRDMYLEVIDCLQRVNGSIYGLPGIIVFIAGNVSSIIYDIYSFVLFPRHYVNDPYLVFSFLGLFIKIVNILLFYMVGDTTEKEINRISEALHQRSVIEKNPRIKRQIKFFLLRRLHEHYHFKLCGICHITLRQLHSLSSKAIGYLTVQILFKLNK